MGMLRDYLEGRAIASVPGYAHAVAEREKNKQASLVSAMIARQAPDIVEPLMGKTLNPTHAAMLETLKRAMMSPDPELQHEAYKMLSNNQDRTFTAINPTDLVKNVNELERRGKAEGTTFDPGVLTDVLMQAIIKPQTQINMGDKPAPMEYIRNYRNPETMKPLAVKPGATMADLAAQGGVIVGDEAKQDALKTPPSEVMAAHTTNRKNIELTKQLIEKLTPGHPEYPKFEAALGAKNKLGELPLGTEALDALFPEQTGPKAEVGGLGMQQIYDASGKAVTAVEDRLGRPIIPKVTNSAAGVRERLLAKLRMYEEANQAIEESYPTEHGYYPFKSTTNSPPAQAERQVVKRAKDATGQEWVLYDDGTEEKVNAK